MSRKAAWRRLGWSERELEAGGRLFGRIWLSPARPRPPAFHATKVIRKKLSDGRTDGRDETRRWSLASTSAVGAKSISSLLLLPEFVRTTYRERARSKYRSEPTIGEYAAGGEMH